MGNDSTVVDDAISNIQEFISQHIETFEAIGVFSISVIILYSFGRFVGKPVALYMLDRSDFDRTIKEGVRRFGHILVILITIMISLVVAGFGQVLATSVILVAILTASLGLSAREVTSNFVSGLVIIVNKNLRYGDWIRVRDTEGIITDIGYRATRIRTFNNELVEIPNSELVSNFITNVGINDTLRIDIVFGIDYRDDIDQAREIIVQEAFSHPEILDTPEPVVRLVEFSGSYVGLEARFWVEDPQRAAIVEIRSDLSQRVKERFDGAGIVLQPPSPQRLSGDVNVDVHEGGGSK